jgi:hypothetical protein
MSEPITRKTLARQIGGDMTADRLRKNERNWGFNKARANTGTRAVLYNAAKAMQIARQRALV